MASKQFNTYCRIIDYVDHADPDLARLIRGLCADMSLGSLKGKPGITFLMPQDKAFRAKLEKLAFSDKTEDANAASDMLNALIIRDVFKSPAEWKSREVPNSLMPSQIVDVDSTSAKEVVFKSGAKAVLDDKFKDASRRGNLAIWKLVSGEIPVTTDKPAQLKFNKNKGKTGGYDPGNIQGQNDRFKIAIAVENAYALRQLQRDNGAGETCDVYLEHVLSLINYIKHVRRDDALLHDKIIPLISLDKFDFYALVEPHRVAGQYLIDNSLITEWWMQKGQNKPAPKTVLREIEQMLSNGSGAVLYSDRVRVLDKIAEIRMRLSQRAAARPRGSVDEITAAYAEFERTNSIGGLGPVYPAALAEYYAGETGLKMLHDELRYLTYGAFKRLESRSFDMSAFHELVNMIGECLAANGADDRARAQKLLNKNSLKYLISPTEKVQEIQIFINSTMFMYMPMTSTEASSLKYKYTMQRPDPSNILLFNISKDLYNQHNRLLEAADEPARQDILSALRSIQLDTRDPALWEELSRKFGAKTQ